MAQFEIVDDFTYEVCLLPKEKALGFVDYLSSIGIRSKAKESMTGRCTVYVTNSLDMSRAKREFLRYANSPFDKQFTQAAWEKGRTVNREKQINAGVLFPMSFCINSITTIVEIICIAVYILSLIDESCVTQYLALSKSESFSNVFDYYKLITPTFVHFSFLHIAFNLVMFETMARPIENTFGKVKFFSLFISIALLSNVTQYCFMTDLNGYFGGLSGVVYGVIGYSGVLSRRKDLPSSFNIPQGLLTVSVIFIVLGFFMGGIANLCHIGGLIVGMLWGYLDLKKLKL